MMILLLKVIVSVLFALSLFHKIYKRSVSTQIILFVMFLWSMLDSYSHDWAVGIVIVGMLILYARAMAKKDEDKFFFEYEIKE